MTVSAASEFSYRRWSPQRCGGDDAAFIAGVRSSGASAYRDVVARLQSTRLQSTNDDDGEVAVETAQAKRRRAPRVPVEDEDRRQYLTERDVEQLCDAARKRGRYGHRDATMILIAYRHGLRVSELVALQWAQVDLEAGRLRVIRRKGSDDSVQPLSGVEIRALRRSVASRLPGCAMSLYPSAARRSPPMVSSRRSAERRSVSAWATCIRTCCGMATVSSWSTMGLIPAPSRHISGIGRSPTRPAIPRWTPSALMASGRTEAAGAFTYGAEARAATCRSSRPVEASAANAAFMRSTSVSDISSKLIRELRAISLTRISSSNFSCIACVSRL
jgi:Phage integrase family